MAAVLVKLALLASSLCVGRAGDQVGRGSLCFWLVHACFRLHRFVCSVTLRFFLLIFKEPAWHSPRRGTGTVGSAWLSNWVDERPGFVPVGCRAQVLCCSRPPPVPAAPFQSWRLPNRAGSSLALPARRGCARAGLQHQTGTTPPPTGVLVRGHRWESPGATRPDLEYHPLSGMRGPLSVGPRPRSSRAQSQPGGCRPVLIGGARRTSSRQVLVPPRAEPYSPRISPQTPSRVRRS